MLTNPQRRELEELISSGQKIVAIKRFREITGVGLAEAVHAVEQLRGVVREVNSLRLNEPQGPDPSAVRQAESAALAALRDGNVIEAIKRYRLYTNGGLKEAKEAVDALSLVHRSDGRIDANLARSLIGLVAAGRKQDAITRLITAKGYDESEAQAFIKTLGGMRVGGQLAFKGCLRALVALILLVMAAALAFFFLLKPA